MRRHLALAATLLPLTFTAACAAPDPLPTIASLGFATETRSVAAGIRSIEIDGPVEVTLVVGGAPSLTIEANDNLLSRVTTETRDGVLHLGLRGWSMGVNTEVKAQLTLPQVEAIHISSVGGVTASGFAGGPLDIDVSGAGSVRLAGAVDRLTVALGGVGSVDADGLVASDAKVTMSGVGSVKLHATRTLGVARGGIGSVTYRGEPELTVTGSGLGNVRRARS